MKGNRRTVVFASAVLLLSACCGRSGVTGDSATRNFPEVSVPSIYTEREDVEDYVLAHFWDTFLDTSAEYRCDSAYVAGVERKQLASEVASYLSILQSVSPDKALESISAFYRSLEDFQKADTTSNAYTFVTEAVEYYLYDPNSEIRNEDLYIPFASGMAASPFVGDGKRVSYSHAVEMCSLNRPGTPAADFRFTDTEGRSHTLYGEKSPLTVLIFVNPGCKACEDVVGAFESDKVFSLISSGWIQILGIYIDEETDKWKEGSDDLPAHWLNGCDPDGVIRRDQIYSVRAIPSIYILDENKNVLLKDAPLSRVVTFLENIPG